MTVHLDDGKFTSKNNKFVMDTLKPTSFIFAEGEMHLTIADCYLFSHKVENTSVID